MKYKKKPKVIEAVQFTHGNEDGSQWHSERRGGPLMERYEIPFWEKYTLSVEEAAAYFRIGENKIRKMINENRDADYILWNNTRAQIKRKKFENYIDRVNIV